MEEEDKLRRLGGLFEVEDSVGMSRESTPKVGRKVVPPIGRYSLMFASKVLYKQTKITSKIV